MVNAELPILQVGVDHRDAGFEVLERAHRAAVEAPPATVLESAANGAVEVVTCHRVELYLEGATIAEGAGLYRRWLHRAIEPGDITVRSGVQAVRHLLRTAAGLESAVLGEDQILGQLRAAYRQACSRALPGPLLHRLFHTAFRAGKRARSETPIQQGCRSLAGAAVSFICDQTGGLDGLSVLILGAGEMARIAALRLRKRGAERIIVANRTFLRAWELAHELEGTAVPWPWRSGALVHAGAIVVATRAERPVLDVETLQAATAGRHRPLVAVDLSVPRNLPQPGRPIANLVTADVSTLEGYLEAKRNRRNGAVDEVERIVEEELDRFMDWYAGGGGAAAGRRRETRSTAGAAAGSAR